MPTLIQNITVKLADNLKGNIGSIDNIRFEMSTLQCNHIKSGNYEAFLIDFGNATNIQSIANNSYYGLIVNQNKTFIELEISY